LGLDDLIQLKGELALGRRWGSRPLAWGNVASLRRGRRLVGHPRSLPANTAATLPRRCRGLVGEGCRLAGQVAVGQTPTSDLAKNLLEAVAVALVSGVESKGLLVRVPEQVEGLNADVSALEGPLEQAPEVLDPVGVNVALNVADRVVNDLVNVVGVQIGIGAEGIGEDLDPGSHVGADLGAEGVAAHILNDLGANDALALRTIALQQSHDGGLAGAASPGVTPLVLVAELGESADEGLVDLDLAAHLLEGSSLHRQADSVEHEPRGLLRDAQRTVKLIGADPVLGAGEQPDRRQPLVEPNRAVLEDGADLDRELLPWVLDLAAPNPTGSDEVDLLAAAGWASHLAIRPPLLNQIGEANVGVREVPDRFKEGGDLRLHHAQIIAQSVSQVYYHLNLLLCQRNQRRGRTGARPQGACKIGRCFHVQQVSVLTS
jgi:hypothetical protein